jgi:hypothetical protein
LKKIKEENKKMRKAKGIVMSGMLAAALLVSASSVSAGDGVMLTDLTGGQEPTVNCGVMLADLTAQPQNQCQAQTKDRSIFTIIVDNLTGILLGG